MERDQVSRGNCYVAAEALYHIMGGKAAGLTPMVLRMPDGERHWYLRQIFYTPLDVATIYIDPSAMQFKGLLPDYKKGRGTGFLTKYPSKRARELIQRLTWQ